MKKMNFPHVVLPQEFVQLLKTNISANASSEPIFSVLRQNRGLYQVLDVAFQEFNDGRGLEKTMVALGWSNFRDRFASLYISKAIHGKFPLRTDMGLVEDIQKFESTYSEMSVSGVSRAFLLGFYLKLGQIHTQELEKNKFLEFRIPDDLIIPILKMVPTRAEKLDWLILTIYHLVDALGEKFVVNSILANRTFDEIYMSMNHESRKRMHDNLLSYGMSIQEREFFLYEKI
jgi:hypothetical protein